MAKLVLSEGVNGRLPQIYRSPDHVGDLDEGQYKFRGMTIDEYKSASFCLFLVLFLATKNGKISAL